MFRKQYFAVGIVGGLEVPCLQRDRTGVIVKQTRLRPNASNKGAFMYTVQFDDPVRTVPGLPARGVDGIDLGDDVQFLNGAAE